jgi:hypothetical protein
VSLLDIVTLGLAAFVINFTAGAWRANQRRLSLRWFVAIHLPIPFVAGLRLLLGLGWEWIPLVVACAIGGQLAGARLYGSWSARRVGAVAAPPPCPEEVALP